MSTLPLQSPAVGWADKQSKRRTNMEDPIDRPSESGRARRTPAARHLLYEAQNSYFFKRKAADMRQF